jgi:hypothetical protein
MLAEINTKHVCQVPHRTSRATPAFVTLARNFPPFGRFNLSSMPSVHGRTHKMKADR